MFVSKNIFRRGAGACVTVLAAALIMTAASVPTAPPAEAADRWTYRRTPITLTPSQQYYAAKDWAGLAMKLGGGCAVTQTFAYWIKRTGPHMRVGFGLGTSLVSNILYGGKIQNHCSAAAKAAYVASKLYSGYRSGTRGTYTFAVKRVDVFWRPDYCEIHVYVRGTWVLGNSSSWKPLTHPRTLSGCFGE